MWSYDVSGSNEKIILEAKDILKTKNRRKAVIFLQENGYGIQKACKLLRS